MIFVQLDNGEWWEYDTKHSRLYNIRGGHTSADNIDLSKAIYLESWHDLYIETGFNPLKSDGLWHCGWLAPNGDFYQCEAHEVDAECIYALIYGDEHAFYSDRLIELGWKKVTNSIMFEYYKDDGQYDRFQSLEQKDTFIEWCRLYHYEV